MPRALTLAAACIAAAAILVVPTSQARQDEPDRSDWFSPCQITYLDLYAKAHEAGHDVGANLVDDRDAKCPEVEESKARLRQWLRPAPATPTTIAEPTATSTVAPVSGGYAIPSEIIMCESGGDYGAVNPSSGAGGAYQIIPSTWAAYGGSTENAADASPAEQDAIAAAIYADSGGDAWVC